MKTFVILLALLVTAKLGYHEYLFRAATREAIIGAYRDRATLACQKDARGAQLGVSPGVWANPAAIGLVIGKGSLEVYIWQVDNEMWSARYRNPYLFLTAAQRTGAVYCEYDIVNAAATVRRM